VGGTPIQNVGAYGQEVAETLHSVVCLDRTTLERRVFGVDECGFGYRSSRFKREDRGRFVVLEVTFRLRRGAPPQLRYAELQQAVAAAGGLPATPVDALHLVRNTVLTLRRKKSMVLDPADPNTRSAGSFFLNPVLATSAFADPQGRWAALGRSGRFQLPGRRRRKVPAARGAGGVPEGTATAAWASRAGMRAPSTAGTSAELLALAGPS
jgi:UDP-N-acetylmuramate dehydrogenase